MNKWGRPHTFLQLSVREIVVLVMAVLLVLCCGLAIVSSVVRSVQQSGYTPSPSVSFLK